MSEPEKKTVPEQVAEILSDAILRSGDAKGIVLAMAIGDGTLYTRGAGNLVTTMGLAQAIRIDAHDHYQESMNYEPEEK